MSASLALRRLQRSAQRRAVAIVLCTWLPWCVLAGTLAWRFGAGLMWLPALLLLITAVAAVRAWLGVDAAWLAQQLDGRHRAFEDSSALLFQDSATLAAASPLQRLQRARLDRRLLDGGPFDPRARWPGRRLAAAAIVALAVSALVYWLPALSPLDAGPVPAGTATSAAPASQRLLSQRLDIEPPAYTGLPKRRQDGLQATVPEAALLRWTLRFSMPASRVALVFHDGVRVPLQRTGEDWTGSRVLRKSSLYRIVIEDAPAFAASARLQRIAVLPDRPPQIRVLDPDRNLSLLRPGQKSWALAFEASDDYGLGAAQLRITLAQGSGENISFSARTLALAGTGDGRRRNYRRNLDLGALGFAVGDDLVVRLQVSDRRPAGAQSTRSASFILRWPPPAAAEATGVEVMVKRSLPAYFRSQRQIIIDSEALLTQRKKLDAEKFLKRSDEIGVDQRILRLRYGQFLGEEADSGRSAPTPPAPPGTAGTAADSGTQAGAAAAVLADADHTDGDAAADNDKATGDATSIIEAFGHTHDEAEAATLLDPDTRKVLKSALDEMWQAELHLRQGQPQLALPFENRALRLIKQVQQASRVYLAKVGLELPPIDEARRLSGDRAGLQSRRDGLTKGRTDPSAPLLLWTALDGAEVAVPADLDRFDRWLREHEASLPDALGLFAALDAVRMQPRCVACTVRLRARLWPLLPRVATPVPGRVRIDATGQRYLEALPRGAGR